MSCSPHRLVNENKVTFTLALMYLLPMAQGHTINDVRQAIVYLDGLQIK